MTEPVRLTSLADVAERAGVSVTTASRVLSQSDHPVAEPTRRRVLEAAAELDFEPNLFARGLVAQRTHLVGVVLHDITDEFTARITRAIEDIAYDNGFSVLICDTACNAEREIAQVRRLRSLRVDGVIFAASSATSGEQQDELVRQLGFIEQGGGALVRLAPHPTVGPDFGWSTRTALGLALDHLADLGHTSVALVTGPDRIGSSEVARHAMQLVSGERGVEFRPDLVLADELTQAGGRRAADALVAMGLPCTGVIALSDSVAAGVLTGLHGHNVAVPDQVSIVGFGDLSVAMSTTPALTTVRVPLDELGRQAMMLAIWVHGGGARPPRQNLPLELVVRGSTAPA